jgi:aspartate/methionine/tyrosine aminotransferase
METMTQFSPAPMMGLVDSAVRYDLAESNTPALRLGDLAGPDELADIRLEYGTSAGDAGLRALVAARTGVDADQVLMTVGASQALFLLAQDRCGPGDHAVITSPCFPPARSVPEGLGARVSPLTVRFEDGFRLPLGTLPGLLTPQTRLVSVASPQNPSGVRLTDAELRGLIAAVDEHAPEAVVLVDETFRESTHGDDPIPPSAATLSPRVVTCASLSKAHGAPGLRLGWLTTTDPELYRRLRNAKFLTTIACSAPDEFAATVVLRHSDKILPARAVRLGRAVAELQDWVADQPVDWVRPDGATICCLRLRDGDFSDAAVRAFHDGLAEHGVRVAPGSWFGADDRVFRLGFGTLPPEEFTSALDRLAVALKTASASSYAQ